MGSPSMKKFHSYPVLGLLQKESSSLNIINSRIYMLSEQTLEKIFKYFSYHEIVKIRCVCNWFYSVAGSILNRKFLSLPPIIDKKIAALMEDSFSNAKIYGYLKVLCIVQSEMKIIQACCEDYVLNNTFYFSGGVLIDIIESILRTSETKEASDLVTQLLLNVDKFLDNFDKSIEPLLLEKSVCLPQSWFGKKIVDIFECSLNCNKLIELRPNTGNREGHCHLKGTYEARKPYSVKVPPQLSSNDKLTYAEMYTLMKYLRNHVRWNNTLNYQLKDDLDNVTEEQCFKESCNLIFKRNLDCNNIPFGPIRLIIEFDLYCLKIFAPMKYRCYLHDVSNSFDSKESIIFDKNDYKFHLKLEIGYVDNVESKSVSKLKCIKFKQKSDMYVLSCDTKVMIINE